MNEPVYAPPKSNLESGVHTQSGEFYVVSLRKLTIMYIGTMGWYNIYWFYRQWSAKKHFSGGSVWPVIPAIFQFIFAFPLFHAVHASLERQGIGAMPSWFLCAALVAVNMIVVWLVAASNYDWPATEASLLSLLAVAMQIGNLLFVQHKINMAALDPGGKSNASLSFANWAWIGFAILMWLVSISIVVWATLLLFGL